MKKVLLLIFLNSVFYILNSFCFAQNRKIDSLHILIKKDQPDTNKVNHLNKLSGEYIKIGEYDSALKFGNKAMALASSLPGVYSDPRGTTVRGWAKGTALSYNNIGIIYRNQGNYSEALKKHFFALKIRQDLGDKQGIAASYNNIGLIYWNQGYYPEALKNHSVALKIREDLGDKQGIATSYNNIGLIYTAQGNYPEALKNLFGALKIREDLNDKLGIATTNNNIGTIYSDQGNYSQALKNYLVSLKIREEFNDKQGIAMSYNNIANVFENQGNYPEALKNHLASLKIREEIKEKQGIAMSYVNIGNIYNRQGDYPEALKMFFASLKINGEIGDKESEAASLINISGLKTKLNKLKEAQDHLYKALQISKEIGSKKMIKHSYSGLSALDSIRGNWKAAYQHQKLFIIYRDSIDNEETKKKTTEIILTSKFEKQEAATKAEQDKKDTIVAAENKKQKIVIWSVACGFLIVLILAAFIFRTLRITRKQKQIIEIKNTETELQKKIIEQKNKDITDSIHYAKKIQDALLREEAHVSLHLPEHFILFMPKDIVSGDFYWGAEKNEYWYFAAVDCTGHGVPGAVMSMLGVSFLNDIFSIEGVPSPAEILNRLRDKIIKALRQTGGSDGNKDGMDISLARLNLKTNELEWAGANNSLNLIQNGQLGILKADKQPIGYHPNSHPFTNHEIQLKKGDSIYIYSDGYADQFGGPKGKKFKYKQLEDLLIGNCHLSLKDQNELLKKRFIEWRGSLEQLDDVCVFGVRV